MEKFAEGGAFLAACGKIAREDAEIGIEKKREGEDAKPCAYPHIGNEHIDEHDDNGDGEGGVGKCIASVSATEEGNEFFFHSIFAFLAVF